MYSSLPLRFLTLFYKSHKVINLLSVILPYMSYKKAKNMAVHRRPWEKRFCFFHLSNVDGGASRSNGVCFFEDLCIGGVSVRYSRNFVCCDLIF